MEDGTREDGATLVSNFLATLSSTPHAIAVQDGQGALSFSELWRNAVSTAAVIRRELSSQFGAGTPFVALCVEENADLVVAMLSIVTAGAAFVPIDLRWPRRRQEEVLRDLAVNLAVVPPGAVPGWEGVGCINVQG
eukprot:Hpha_TRINITY_DN14145_c3_g1::TRINITY_DN14145_c3_g1_i1::g.11107::m.11107